MAINKAQELLDQMAAMQASTGPAMAGSDVMGQFAQEARDSGSGFHRFMNDPLGLGKYRREIQNAKALDAINLNAAAERGAVQGAMPGMAAEAERQLNQAGVTDPNARFGAGYQLGKSGSVPEVAAADALRKGIMQDPAYSPKAAQSQQLELEKAVLAKDKLKLDIDTGRIQNTNTLFTQEGNLRDDAVAALAETSDALLAYSQLKNVLASKDPIAAQAAVIKIAKLLDPGSVVRTEEGEAIKGGTGLALALQNSLNIAIGEGMTDEMVNQFTNLTNQLIGPYAQEGIGIYDGIAEQAERFGIDPAYALSQAGVDRELLQRLAGGGNLSENSVIDLTKPQPGPTTPVFPIERQ